MPPHQPTQESEAEQLAREKWELQEGRFLRGEARRKKLPPEWLFLIIVGVLGLSFVNLYIYMRVSAERETIPTIPTKAFRQAPQ